MPDILQDLGYLALGSRLKRLAERLQADAAQIFEQNCFVTQPSHFPLLAALDRYGPLTVSEAVSALGVSQPAVTRSLVGLVDMGLAETTVSETDRRQKSISLTMEGAEAVARMKRDVWPHVARAAEELAAGPDASLLEQIARIEAAFDEKSLTARATDGHAIVDFSDDLAGTFYTINEEWISEMFTLEATDREILSHPRELIVDKGGGRPVRLDRRSRHCRHLRPDADGQWPVRTHQDGRPQIGARTKVRRVPAGGRTGTRAADGDGQSLPADQSQMRSRHPPLRKAGLHP